MYLLCWVRPVLTVSNVIGPRTVCIECVIVAERLFLYDVVDDPTYSCVTKLCYAATLCLVAKDVLRPYFRYSVLRAYMTCP